MQLRDFSLEEHARQLSTHHVNYWICLGQEDFDRALGQLMLLNAKFYDSEKTNEFSEAYLEARKANKQHKELLQKSYSHIYDSSLAEKIADCEPQIWESFDNEADVDKIAELYQMQFGLDEKHSRDAAEMKVMAFKYYKKEAVITARKLLEAHYSIILSNIDFENQPIVNPVES